MNISGFEMIKDLSFRSLIDWSDEQLGFQNLYRKKGSKALKGD